MKVLAFSDLHGSAKQARLLVDAAAEADLVIGAGDFCNMRHGLAEAMMLLSGIDAPVVAVPGNAESADELRSAALPGMTVLHGESYEVNGLRLFGIGYGIPVTPFGAWSCDLTEDTAAHMLAGCEGADVLISHSPPRGVADQTSAGVSVGSTAVRLAIEGKQPRFCFCGHIHDSWGTREMIGDTQVANLGPFANWFDL